MLGANLTAIALMPRGPAVFGISVDFIVFGLTLLSVAVFHHHTLRVALAGLVTITIYKVVFTGLNTGDGAVGFVSHVGHGWVLLASVLVLLAGFASWLCHFAERQRPV